MVQLAYRLKVTPDDLIPDDVRPTENPEEITQDYIDSLSLSDYYKDSLKDLKDRGELGGYKRGSNSRKKRNRKKRSRKKLSRKKRSRKKRSRK